jgi:hypothetical protein
MQRIQKILKTCQSSDTQVAYINCKEDEYKQVYACELSRAIYADFDHKQEQCEGDEKKLSILKHRVRTSHCAGKLYTIGVLIGKGEELSFHCQWKDREKCSYFSRLPCRDGTKANNYTTMKNATYENGCQVNDCHDLAIRLLKEAINNGIRITFTCKCVTRHHILDIFTTDSTMYAKSEITLLNGDMNTVRLDLVVYTRMDDTVLFCVEVFNTHKTVANSRQIAVENGKLLWCEVIAGRVLDVLEDCDDNTTTITIPTEPRMDVERSCTKCIRMDEVIRKRKAEEAEFLKRKACQERNAAVQCFCSMCVSRKSALAPQELTKVVFFVGNDKVFGVQRKSGFGPHEKDVHLQGEISAVICRNMISAIAVCFVAHENPPDHSISLPLTSEWLCHKMFSYYSQHYREEMRKLADELNRDKTYKHHSTVEWC